MKAFEYAAPRHEADVLELLSPESGASEILAGGTDLIPLMKKMIVTPARVVNIKEVRTLSGIQADSTSVTIGAVTRLDEILNSPELDDCTALKQAVANISSQQLQEQGTLGGELCQRPRCWYFRNGFGLLAREGRLIAEGKNRYHAIFGNSGPAKFVNPSRLAPGLIALGAQIRILGPGSQAETWLPLEDFFRTPRHEQQREIVLSPNQLVAQIRIPRPEGLQSATYDVRHGEGPDYPLASAAAGLRISGGVVQEARIVLGQVAPTPRVAYEAAEQLLGRAVNHTTAQLAADVAVADATPLSDNRFKVQLARTAVKRAVLMAAGLETGGI
jgi:xanthine dehydrogenase YagS FAD-binding subunit